MTGALALGEVVEQQIKQVAARGVAGALAQEPPQGAAAQWTGEGHQVGPGQVAAKAGLVASAGCGCKG